MGNAVDTIAATFRAQHANGDVPGGQLAVAYRGETVLDLALGLASGHRASEPKVEATTSTFFPVFPVFPVFSVSKPFVATAIAMLEERGRLDVNAPLSTYVPGWPSDRTVLDVLTRRTGILLPDIVADDARWGDRARIVRAIAERPPKFPRGTLAYAPYEYGWMLAEVFEGAAKEPLPQFLEREFLKPAGIDVRFTTDSPHVARNCWLGPKHVVAGVELSARWEAAHNSATTRATFVLRHWGSELAASMLLGMPQVAQASNARRVDAHEGDGDNRRGDSALNSCGSTCGSTRRAAGAEVDLGGLRLPGPGAGSRRQHAPGAGALHGRRPDARRPGVMFLGPGFAPLGFGGISWGALVTFGRRERA